jgi:hypothetical protein
MTGRRILGIAFAALAVLALGAASRIPWTASPPDRALIRLSWRARSVVAVQCRPLTEAEKADLPVHMQVPEVCETHAIPYVLQATIDGAALPADTLHGAGAREDRPVIVFREIPLSVGAHAIELTFRPLVDPDDLEESEEPEEEGDRDENDEEGKHEEDGDDRDREDRYEDHEGRDEDEGLVLEYSETIRLDPREIALLTLDRERRSLIRAVQSGE